MFSFLICLALLIGGYFVYGGIVEKTFGPDDRETPAVKINDGVDYMVLPQWKLFMIQLLNIAGLGPIFGALSGALWGPVVFLWITFGTIFAGAVHDYFSGMMSERNEGASISEISGIYLGGAMKNVMRVFSVVLLVMVGTVFAVGPAGLIQLLFTNGGSTGIVASKLFWLVLILIYYFIATFLSIDKIIGKIYPLFGICLIIMALGVGISAIRSDRHAADDSFGLVALCSIGPILAVLILGIAYSPGESSYTAAFLPDIQDSVELWDLFMVGLPAYFKEIALSLLPIMVFFGVYQFAVLHMSRKALGKILVGLFYTYIGLVLFLTGANVGFMPAGNYLGQVLAALPYRWVLIPLGMLIGYFIVKAEPAVYVLNKQVEEVTDGSISAKAMGTSLSIGVALSVGLAMLRVLTGISILWMLVPGYGIAIGLSFFVPKIFTAIAFDSGGVASGPMTATFLLPLAMGACTALGGNVVTDAFGVVALVALAPPVAIQIMGVLYVHRSKAVAQNKADLLSDDGVIDLEDEEI